MTKIDERSAGFIIYKESTEHTHFLLLRNGKLWGFPKGHIEYNESPLRAALRETKEEANITVKTIIPEFKVSNIYKMKWDFTKQKPLLKPRLKDVTFFLGESSKYGVTLSEEHNAWKWCTLNEALQLLKFKTQKDNIKRAHTKIKTMVERVDIMPGGLGDKKTADDVDKQQLQMGISVETEHTTDPKIAMEIALDHLTEDPEYYTKLDAIEEKLDYRPLDPFVTKAWALFASTIYEPYLAKTGSLAELNSKYQKISKKLPTKFKPYIDYFYEYKKDAMGIKENVNEGLDKKIENIKFQIHFLSRNLAYQFIPKTSEDLDLIGDKAKLYDILTKYVKTKTKIDATPDYNNPAAGFVIKLYPSDFDKHMEKMVR